LRNALYTFSTYLLTVKITSEFKNVSVTVGVVDGLALHGKQTSAASTGGNSTGGGVLVVD